jgi:hydrogenase maturation protease
MKRVVVAAMGSRHPRDDGAGLAVAERVAAAWEPWHQRGADGGSGVEVVSFHDPLDLLGRWDTADLAVVVDATRSGAPPGTVRTVHLDGGHAASAGERTTLRRSTHGMGVAEVFRLAEIVGTAPKSVVLVGIEGDDFGLGEGMSPAVLQAVDAATVSILALLREAR